MIHSLWDMIPDWFDYQSPCDGKHTCYEPPLTLGSQARAYLGGFLCSKIPKWVKICQNNWKPQHPSTSKNLYCCVRGLKNSLWIKFRKFMFFPMLQLPPEGSSCGPRSWAEGYLWSRGPGGIHTTPAQCTVDSGCLQSFRHLQDSRKGGKTGWGWYLASFWYQYA